MEEIKDFKGNIFESPGAKKIIAGEHYREVYQRTNQDGEVVEVGEVLYKEGYAPIHGHDGEEITGPCEDCDCPDCVCSDEEEVVLGECEKCGDEIEDCKEDQVYCNECREMLDKEMRS